MRIAYVLSAFPIISETFVLNQITGLVDAGHEVDILVLRYGETQVVHQDVTKYHLLDNIHLAGDAIELMPRNKFKRVLKGLKIFAQSSHAEKRVLLRCLNFARLRSDAWTLSLFFRAHTALQQPRDYDVIHCHFGNNGIRAIGLVAVGVLDAPVVTTFHGHDITKDVVEKGKDAYSLLFNAGDMMLPVSQLWRQELVKLGCAEEKIQVHRMGIDLGHFTVKEHQEKSPCTILSVARMVEKKGLIYAVAAIKIALAELGDVRYLIVGDGPLEAELRAQIEEHGLQEHVQLLGRKSQDEVHALMNQSDIFLLPSVTASSGDMEGVPVVLMEAMACAIPVVSTVHSGIPELVDHEQSGYLVPERDVDALARSLVTLAKDAQLRTRFGHEGREKVMQEFNIHRLNEDLVARFSALR